MGMGPRTGRAAGFCAGYDTAGWMSSMANRTFGMGYGKGRGGRWRSGGSRRGGGWHNFFSATGLPRWMRAATPPAPEQAPGPDVERQFLTDQAAELQTELDDIRRRLKELEAGTEK